MGKVILMVNVELDPRKRDEYLGLTSQLKERFAENGSINYAVFENQGKEANLYTEVFTFPDAETYEAFDDDEDEATKDLFGRITDLSVRSPRYTTLVEVG